MLTDEERRIAREVALRGATDAKNWHAAAMLLVADELAKLNERLDELNKRR